MKADSEINIFNKEILHFAASYDDGEDIQAEVMVPGMDNKVMIDGAEQGADLALRNAGLGKYFSTVAAFYFNEMQHAGTQGNDVDLTMTKTEIALDHLETLLLQPVCRQRLSFLPKVYVNCHDLSLLQITLE